MKEREINDLLDEIENLYLENQVAKRYMRVNCGISEPSEVLREGVKKIPHDSLVRRAIVSIGQKIGQGLQDSEVLETICKALAESAKTQQD